MVKDRVIIGYGASHDAGIAGVEAHSGRPLFAASLERLTRRKNQPGSPLALAPWAERTVGQKLYRATPLDLTDDRLFRADCGFHQFESTAEFDYRWTAAEAVLQLPPETACTAIVLGVIPQCSARRSFVFDLILNGQRQATLTNRKESWTVKAPPGSGPIREIRIRAKSPLTIPPDPRQLGVPVTWLAIIPAEECAPPEVEGHATSEVPAGENLRRLVRKQFLDLPRLSLRGHSTPRLSRHATSLMRVLAHGYPSPSDRLLNAGFPFPISGRYDHHLCHAAGAFYQSGFDKALVVSLDGMGDWLSCRVMRGESGALKPLAQFYYEQVPIGLNYEIVTALLGFSPMRHAGKITGLAAYGRENPACDAALDAFFRRMWRKGGPPAGDYEYFLRDKERGLGRLRALRDTEFAAFSREDLSYAIQKRTEREVLDLISRFRNENPDLTDIALAGGVFANVRVNQKVHELGFRRIFVQPAMSDAGLCMGAALLECARQKGGALPPYRLEHVYLGPEFSHEEIAAELERHGLRSEFVEEGQIAEVIARHIAERRAVAHFHGRMEFGPRALGNRSILYSAADPDVNRWLNDQLNRTEFMPFAPAILAEHASEYFERIHGAEHAAEFMTITFDCTEKGKREIPAAVHVDGTARPQFVRRETNPRFHAILTAYRELTGVPVVINTSFNMHEEPIVATPDDAIRSFLRGNLDVLVLGNYIVQRQGLPGNATLQSG